MILFTNRRNYEILFEEYCKKTKAQNCPMNFIAWMQSQQEGRELVLKLFADLLENLLIRVGGNG